MYCRGQGLPADMIYKRKCSAVIAQCFPMGPTPRHNCLFLGWNLDPHLIHGSLGYPSQYPKRHLDRFSRFCTAHSTVYLYFTMGRHFPPQNCPLPLGYLHPHLMHGFLGLFDSTPKRHLDRFSRFCRAHERDQQTQTETMLHRV